MYQRMIDHVIASVFDVKFAYAGFMAINYTVWTGDPINHSRRKKVHRSTGDGDGQSKAKSVYDLPYNQYRKKYLASLAKCSGYIYKRRFPIQVSMDASVDC